VSADPSAVDEIAEQWFYLALCRRDFAEVTRALASVPPEGIIPVNVRMPHHFCEGLAARAQDDVATAERAFAAARAEMEAILKEAEYAEAFCILAMSDAALGRKDEALTEGRRAIELCPVSKDAVLGAELLRNLAVIQAWVGEKDLAFKQLEELLQIPCPISYGELRLHPYWDLLRDDPRFERLISQAREPVQIKQGS
jgi:tetratricopeptide (TPR) repeat protein